MNPYNQGYGTYAQGAYAGSVDYSAVLRQVYLWLAVGLLAGFGVAFGLDQQIAAGQPLAIAAVTNPIFVFGGIIAYLVVGFAFYPIVQRVSPGIGAVLYLAFAVLFGFMTATIFLRYTAASVAFAFVISAGMFAIMSVIGYTTRLDLSKFGAIFFMALIGVILASVVNIFLHSSALSWIISLAAVVIFTGLVAYDTQWIKRQAAALSSSSADENMMHRIALIGAFRLFLDFVNLFLNILRLTGSRR